ncbi:MAG TPA: M48 family metallopeptidase [Candidatus Omnitrophota bacterium]|nr:M48 family metallopeptidase [Candidatus Omnitrophota bacterium]
MNNVFKLFLFSLEIFIACIVCGCASLGSYNAATGQREFIMVPTDQEVTMGEDAHRKLLTEFKLSEDPDKVARVKRIGARVSQVSERQDYQYHFFLIEKDEINAFTTPGGNVYFFTGLLDKLHNDDQVAAVLAHEVGHCAARHTIKKFQAALSYSLIGSVIFNTMKTDGEIKRVAALGTDVVMNLVFSAYSRQDELQADRLGIKYMDLAGYHLNAMIETFEVLKKESKGPQPPLLLRTHPYIDDRIEAAKKEIQRIKTQ